MKKLLAVILAALMLAALAGCRGGDSPSSPTPAPQAFTDSFETGKLSLTAFSIRHDITGLALSGSAAGSGIDDVPCALEGLRPVFELDEIITYRLGYGDSESGECLVYVRPHTDFHLYKNADLEDGAVFSKAHDFGASVDGSFTVSSEKFSEGWYDLLFVTDGSIIANCVIKLLPKGELAGKTDAELNAMSEAIKN